MNLTSFFIDQHGCSKNQTDAELLIGYLTENGFVHTFDSTQADFILINSCGFIESAKKESIDAIYQIRNSYPNAKIILTGCLAERYSQLMYDSIPELDGVFGNGDLSKIVEFMKSVQNGNRLVKTYPQEGVCSGNRPVVLNFPGSAYVKITEGCSNYCSFCAIPLIRGEVRSRPIVEIVEEIKSLLKNNIYEINLIGQDLAAYGTGKNDNVLQGLQVEVTNKTSYLAMLFSQIAKLEQEFNSFIVRPLYIHPDHFNLDILPVMKSSKCFVPYFDIPFQSGDDKIIKLMNRVGSAESYSNLVNQIKSFFPEAAIRTTFLVGFPGETDENFENTCDFVETIKPMWSGSFVYSREENTPAYNFKKRISSKIAEKRVEKLQENQQKITENYLKDYVGKEISVIIEEVIQNNPEFSEDVSEGLAIGRAWFQAPDVDGCVVVKYDSDDVVQEDSVKPGNVLRAKVLTSSGVDLDARLIKLERSLENKK